MSQNTLKHHPIHPQVSRLVEGHHRDPEAILEVFRALQAKEGYLSRERVSDVARALRIPTVKAQGIATFYTLLATSPRAENTLRVCDGPACWLKGAGELRRSAAQMLGEGWHVERSSCLGLCDRAPAALVNRAQCGPLTAEGLKRLASGSDSELRVACGKAPDYTTPLPGEVRVMLADIDKIDPHSLDSALEHGAYQALKGVLHPKGGATPLEGGAVIEEVKAAGVRGRGGAGFPVGVKWGFVAAEKRTPKYVVCNADESEPLVFKDRVLIEHKPHQLLEGMALCAYAVGAEEGFIYIRGEYETQADILENAIRQAEERGFLGERILDTGFRFRVHVHRGAGAYICGEETALLESLEGRRGEPRIRPPYPTVSGYHGMPTVVNNVESFSAIPAIVQRGADWYKSLSPDGSPGTKLFLLSGHVNRPGVFEAPFGLTLRTLIERFGGGMKPGSQFHFALSGGAAGTIVPPSLLDVPVDYGAMEKGLSLGAGAFLVCDQSLSPVALLRELMHFFEVESCGKCTPCREGTREARQLLDRILAGEGQANEVARLEALAGLMGSASFCGLGQATRLPIESALAHFERAFRR